MPGKDTSQVNNASEAGSSLAAGCNCATCPKNAFDTSSCVCSRVAASRSKFAAERTWDAGESDPQREARFIIATSNHCVLRKQALRRTSASFA